MDAQFGGDHHIIVSKMEQFKSLLISASIDEINATDSLNKNLLSMSLMNPNEIVKLLIEFGVVKELESCLKWTVILS